MEGKAGGEVAAEAADEGVAGAWWCSIASADRRDPPRFLCRRQKPAAGAEGDDDRFDPPSDEGLCRGADSSSDSTGSPVRMASSVSFGMRKLASRARSCRDRGPLAPD